MLLFIEVLLLFQLLLPTALLGESLLCFYLFCVCALPFSQCPQEALCNVRQQQQQKPPPPKPANLRNETLDHCTVGLCSDANDESLFIRVCTFGFTTPFSIPPPGESEQHGWAELLRKALSGLVWT